MQFILLSLFVFAALAAHYSVDVVDLYDSDIMRGPWFDAEYGYSDQATDVYTLPYRYGFRMVGRWDLYDPLDPYVNDRGYVPPSHAWFQFCPYTPRFTSDDFTMVIESFGDTNDCTANNVAGNCHSSNLDFILATVQEDGLTPVILQRSVLSDRSNNLCVVGTAARRMTFNFKDMKAMAPRGLYFIITNSNPSESGSRDAGLYLPFEFRFARQQSFPAWNPASTTSCSFDRTAVGVADALSLCRPSVTSLFDCSNGVYQAELEECDLILDPHNCGPNCICKQPFVPDEMGGCTSCGNGLFEPLWGEVCDYEDDENCAEDCKGCAEGYGYNDFYDECSQCGNGEDEDDESCDPLIDEMCTWECECMDGYVSDDLGGCTTCGNGVLDKGEYCDAKDPACAADCGSCRPPYISKADSPDCVLCGNFEVDEGEVCDSTDYNCEEDCSACTPLHVADETGHCTRCGNGLLDKGEECDSASRSGCSDDCQACAGGLVPTGDKYGLCSTCGNGVIEPDEACDYGLDEACFGDCSGCSAPSASVGRRCVTCGNGMRDETKDDEGQVISSEACDAAQPGCLEDCSACEDGWIPSGDATGTCVPQCAACCEELKARQGEDDATAPANTLGMSIAIFLLGFLATLH